jgi:PAS domain S-box-containing protein
MSKNFSIEGKAKIVLNLLSDVAVVVDEKGRLVVVNDVFEEVTGLSQKEVTGKSFLEIGILSAESKRVLLENLMKRMQGLPVEPYEVYFTDKTGESTCVEVKGRKVSYAGQPADLVVFHDVTHRKENERRLKEYSERMEALVSEKVREIKESAEKLRSVFDSSPDAIAVFDLNGRIIECNQAKVTMYGFSSKDELIGKSAFELISPKDRQKTSLMMEETLKTGLLKNIEYTSLTKDGREFPAESSAGILKDAEGNPTGFVSITKDITERKRTQQQLQASEAKFRAITNSAIDAVFLFDEEDRINYWNPAAERIFGYAEKEIVGKQVNATLVPPGFRKHYLKLTAKLAKIKNRKIAGKIREFPALRKDGTEFRMELSLAPLQLEGKTHFTAIVRDITERKKVEEALRESEEKFRTISNSIEDGLIVVANNGDIVFWNPAAQEIFGYTQEEVLGKKVQELLMSVLDAEKRKLVDLEFEGFLGTEKGVLSGKTVELTARRKDGTEFSFRLSVTSMRLKDKWYAVALARDITEQKQLWEKVEEYSRGLELTVDARTQELKEANERLLKAERLAAIGELAGMVGHDLRNPLTGIKNAAYYLRVKQGSCSDGNIKKMFEIIDCSIAHADKIINDLLDYSREIRLELVNCSPRALFKEALSLVQVPETVNIIDNTLEEPLISVDKAKMVRVFINIVENAVDAMPGGGTLQVESAQKNGNVEISFADTGIGMSKETLGKLFSPLVTTKAQGMGFGLAICKRIVEAHQGRIAVESVEGKGSTFTVTIPIKPELKNGGEETWVNMPESLLSTTTKT